MIVIFKCCDSYFTLNDPMNFDLISCKMQSDLTRHREFHNAVLAYHCDVDGCNFSARCMQTVKRHQKVDHQVR